MGIREIIFRGKSLVTDNWVYGNLIIDKWGDDNNNIIYGILRDREAPAGVQNWIPVRVDEKTIGQFTGLLDKGGKKIYEGDIVTQPVRETRKHSNCIVEFINGKFQSHYKSKNKYYDRYYDINSYTKVIGNIYDNKDLLE